MLPTVAELAARHPWRPIAGCPGRSHLPPTDWLTLVGVDVDPPPVLAPTTHPVVTLALPGGGGILGYVRPEGLLPTLNTPDGWARKLTALALPPPPDPAVGDAFEGDPRLTPVAGLQRTAPAGLVDLREAGLPLQFAIAYATPDNFTGQPLPGYGAPGAWLAAAAAEGLARAAEALDREGLVLRVFDAFRPIRATEAMYTWAAARGRRHLFADGWIARRSMHNRGVAVDVTLIDARTGEALPMGTAFDAFDPGSSYPNASGAAATHRRQLRAAMAAAGFATTDLEWWHFELGRGDEARRDAPYGAAEAPSALG